jgi:hypothetical protein
MDTSRSPIPVTPGAPESVQEKSGFRTKSIGTRVTPEELRLIEAAAERDGKKFAEWMREEVLKARALLRTRASCFWKKWRRSGTSS